MHLACLSLPAPIAIAFVLPRKQNTPAPAPTSLGPGVEPSTKPSMELYVRYYRKYDVGLYCSVSVQRFFRCSGQWGGWVGGQWAVGTYAHTHTHTSPCPLSTVAVPFAGQPVSYPDGRQAGKARRETRMGSERAGERAKTTPCLLLACLPGSRKRTIPHIHTYCTHVPWVGLIRRGCHCTGVY